MAPNVWRKTNKDVFWAILGKNPSKPKNIACSYTYVFNSRHHERQPVSEASFQVLNLFSRFSIDSETELLCQSKDVSFHCNKFKNKSIIPELECVLFKSQRCSVTVTWDLSFKAETHVSRNITFFPKNLLYYVYRDTLCLLSHHQLLEARRSVFGVSFVFEFSCEASFMVTQACT